MILDLIVIGILALCIFWGYRKGFVITVFNFCSLLITLFLTNLLYPFVSALLRSIGVFTALKSSVAGVLPLDDLTAGAGAAQTDFISGLALPGFIKDALLANNTSEQYASLAVNTVGDYVSSFLAWLILNAISMLLVFVVVFVLMKVAAVALNILTKLPVIHTLNKLLGVAVGLLQGTLFTWLVLAILVGLFATNQSFPVGTLLPETIVAKWFHESNIILKLMM